MDLDAALTLLAREPAAPLDLAEVALHLARDEYPDLDVDAYLSELNGMAHEAKAHLRGGLEGQVKGLCRYLFHDMGFRGNTAEYYDPRNSYLNQVLDRRTGIPITLSAVVLAVGARAGLEVGGVGLPGHFVVKAAAAGEAVLFDPFHGGRRLTAADCEQLVEKATGLAFRATRAALQALPLGLIVLRMLNNLKGIYLKTGDYGRAVRVLRRLRQVNPAEPLHHRDLGVCLLKEGLPGQAIDHLQAYLASGVEAAEAETTRRLLDRARGEVARWN